MRTKKFKELIENTPKHQIVWKIVKNDLKISDLKLNQNKNNYITKNQYKEILNMEG